MGKRPEQLSRTVLDAFVLVAVIVIRSLSLRLAIVVPGYRALDARLNLLTSETCALQ